MFVNPGCEHHETKICCYRSMYNLRGMFSTGFYSTVREVNKLIPIYVYLQGCLPKLEGVIDVITTLCKKISRKIYEDKIKSQQENREHHEQKIISLFSENSQIVLTTIFNFQF